jgi:hypothetical protein
VATGFLTVVTGCSGSSAGITTEELGSAGGRSDETSGGWSRHVQLLPADDSVRGFGNSVALGGDGTSALVSATSHEGADGLAPGPAYVLGRSDSEWRQRAALVPEDDDSTMNFGGKGRSTALSADGTTALVGAERVDDPNGPESGAAYLFERTDDAWAQQDRLVPHDGERKDFFGKSVALSADGTVALVGAWGNDDSSDEGVGSAYVFERTDDAWRQTDALAPDDGGAFGWSVSLASDATVALVGAPGDGAPDRAAGGTAYVFERAGSGWRRAATLVPDDGETGDFFGASVTLADDTAIVGAPEDDNSNGESAGSVYVFERAADAWTQQARLVPDDGDSTDLFGIAVAVTDDGTTALFGARVDEDPNGEAAGAAYVFERTEDAWTQQAKLAPENGESHDVFGRSVAVADDTAVIGTQRAGAYVYS